MFFIDFCRVLGRVGGEKVTEIFTSPTCFCRALCVDCVVQHFDLGNAGCMTSRGSPESQNIGDFDWGNWGEKLALIMYRNFVIIFRRMH